MKNKLPYNVFNNPNDWDKSPRDPISIASAITGIATTATGVAAAGLWATSFLVGLGISAITSWAMAALTPGPSGQDRGLITNVRDAAAPREYVYGEVRKGGVITYLESTGENNKFLHLVLTMAAHEVESITDFYINDEVVAVESATTYNITYVGDRERGREGDPEPFTTVFSFSVPPALDYAVSASLTEPQFLEIVEQAYSKEVTSGFEYSGNVTFTSATIDSKGTGGGYVTDERWKGKVRIEAFTGDQTAAAGTLFGESEVLVGTEGAKFIGYNIAYMYIRLEYDGEVFPNGIPVFTAKVRGKKVYDPRTTLTAYSANAALCIRDYLVSEYGMDDAGFTDDTVFASAANVCDEDVDLATAGTQPRYEINGVISAASTPGDILQSMTTACAGTLFWGQGKWQLKPGYYTAPTKTLTLDDLRGPISLSTRVSRRDNFNIVRGTFNNKEARYIQEDYPELKSAAFIAEDNGLENALDLTLPLTTDSAMAQRLAKMTLFRGREQMSFTAEFGVNAFDVQVGDIVAFTNDRYGWTAKEFEVLSWDFHSSEEGGDLRVTLTLQETSAAAFSWTAEESDIIGNNATLPTFNAGLDVSNLQVFESGRVTKDGTFVGTAILSWAKSPNSFIDHYEVEWKVTSDLNYASTSTSGLSIELSPIVDGVEYTFRVRAVTVSDVKGAWAEVTLTGGGDSIAPNEPTGLVAIGYFQSATLGWLAPTTNVDATPIQDLNSYNIYRSLTNTFGTATVVGNTKARSFNDAGLADNTTYYYWVTTLDNSGNESIASVGDNATTNFISAAEMVADIRNEIGAARVDTVGTLPVSGYVSGDFVFLTTDGKLYQYDGASWNAVVPNIETGDITSTMISDGAISTPKIDTNAITADKIATDAITADKILANSITTGKIEAGAVSAGKMAVTNLAAINVDLGAVTAGSINTLSGGTGVQINVSGKEKSTYIYQNNPLVYALYAENQTTSGGGGSVYIESVTGFALQVEQTGSASGVTAASIKNSTGGHGQVGLSSADGSYAFNAKVGGYFDESNVGYLTFTGAHLAFINKGETFEVGDIVCDRQAISTSITDSVTRVSISSSPMEKSSVGVFAAYSTETMPMVPAIVDKEETDKKANKEEAKSVKDKPSDPDKVKRVYKEGIDLEQLQKDYELIRMNSVGEGAVNVCGENGDIQAGDLIVTSSMPGKGMKQGDDIIRSYTVAKARDNVTFSNPSEVKMIACIYLCG